MLVARSVAEAHLYLDLAGCDREDRNHRLVAEGDALVSLYDCSCGGERKTWRFRIDVPEPAGGGTYGDAEPSTLIGPGSWLRQADQLARSVPADPAGLSEEDRRAAQSRLIRAAECVAEVLKFVPEGSDAVPEGAFATDADRQIRALEPGRFRAGRLMAVLETYRRLATRF